MLTQLHKDIDYTGFKFSGFTQDYMWHVLYYVAYTLVGNTNIADSLTAKENILEDQTIKFLTDENYDEYVDYFDRYKGYDEVLPNIIETVFELSINASNLNLSTYDYFSGENWETTLYPSVYAQQIIFYDDINNISDAIELPYEEDDELPEYDEDDDYIYEDNTEPGTARRLRKVIMIPKLNKNSEDKGLKTEFSGLIVGFQNDLKDIVINIYYNGYYENGTKEENIKMMFPEDKTGNYLISKNNVLTYKGINTGSLYCDFYGDTVSDNQTGKLFGSATTNVSGISNIERFVTDAFKTEKYRVSKSGEIFDIGVLGTHNRLFKLNTTKGSSSYNINLSKNYFDLTFNYAEYKNKESIELEVAPLVNLMYFIPF